MKIVLTGGGSGGHFFPLIAVAEAINEIAATRKLIQPNLFYVAPEPYDERVLFEHNIEFRKSSAGKLRRYFSVRNFFDAFKTGWGILKTVFQLFSIYPDVVFSKGGYASFPTVFAARLLRIPIVIHESDTQPGRVNKWAAKFARSISISYPETADFFPKKKVAYTGNPVRSGVRTPAHEGAYEFLKLESDIPILLFLNGSQGAQRINDTILDMLPELLEQYQVIHQTGKENFKEVKATAEVILEDHKQKYRYRPFDFLNDLALRMSAGVSKLVISRGGSGAIFEIASWGLPSIIIPIPESISHDQRKNAFAYSRRGAAVVVEEHNLTPHVLLSEINRLMNDETKRKELAENAKSFSKPNAAKIIAEELIAIGLEHEEN